jgi:hypothetical protein
VEDNNKVQNKPHDIVGSNESHRSVREVVLGIGVTFPSHYSFFATVSHFIW